MILKPPRITGSNPQDQISQIRSYLFQLVNELNYSLAELEKQIKNSANTNGGE